MPGIGEPSSDTLVFIPTYNEVGNVAHMLDRIFKSLPNTDVLLVDDASPDGTADGVRRYQKEHPQGHRVKLLVRAGKMGIGSAHRLAMFAALRSNYDFLITMDGDGSHEPESLSEFRQALEHWDFVIGSRFLEGSLNAYEGYRFFLSQSANGLLNRALNMNCTEFTTAYRGFRCDWLKTFPFYRIQGQGYNFFFQCLYWVRRLGARTTELPIQFHNRREGESKINVTEILLGVFFLMKIILIHRLKCSLPPGEMDEGAACEICGETYLEVLGKKKSKCLVCGQLRPH